MLTKIQNSLYRIAQGIGELHYNYRHLLKRGKVKPVFVFIFGIFRPSLWFEDLIAKAAPRKYWYADLLVLLVPICGVVFFGWDSYIVMLFVMYELAVGLIIALFAWILSDISRKWIMVYITSLLLFLSFYLMGTLFVPDWAFLHDPSKPFYEIKAVQMGTETKGVAEANFANLNGGLIWDAVFSGWIFLIYIPLFELFHLQKEWFSEERTSILVYWLQFGALTTFTITSVLLAHEFEAEQAILRGYIFWFGIVLLTAVISLRNYILEFTAHKLSG